MPTPSKLTIRARKAITVRYSKYEKGKSPCNDCQRLDGDELGVYCSKHFDGLPFVPHLYICKYQVKKEG